MRLFFSYAHDDAELFGKLKQALATLLASPAVHGWSDYELLPGDDPHANIEAAQAGADVHIMLVTRAFLASSYCTGIELERAVELERFGARIVPIIGEVCDWRETKLTDRVALPQRAPLSARPLDEGLQAVVDGLRDLIKAYSTDLGRCVSRLRAIQLACLDFGREMEFAS